MKSEKVKGTTVKAKKKNAKTKSDAMSPEEFRETAISTLVECELKDGHQFQKHAAVLATVDAAVAMGWVTYEQTLNDEFRQKFVHEVEKVYPRALEFVIRRCPDFGFNEEEEC